MNMHCRIPLIPTRRHIYLRARGVRCAGDHGQHHTYRVLAWSILRSFFFVYSAELANQSIEQLAKPSMQSTSRPVPLELQKTCFSSATMLLMALACIRYLDSSLTQHCHTTPTICLELQVIQCSANPDPPLCSA